MLIRTVGPGRAAALLDLPAERGYSSISVICALPAGHPARQAFTAGVPAVGEQLSAAPDAIDCARRLEALRDWSLSSEEWQHLTCRPATSGYTVYQHQKVYQDVASMLIWARTTQCDHRYAPVVPARDSFARRHALFVRLVHLGMQRRRQPSGSVAVLFSRIDEFARNLARSIDTPDAATAGPTWLESAN